MWLDTHMKGCMLHVFTFGVCLIQVSLYLNFEKMPNNNGLIYIVLGMMFMTLSYSEMGAGNNGNMVKYEIQMFTFWRL